MGLFLGVDVDQSLEWNYHIEKISAKLARNIGIIFRIAYLLQEHIRTSLYYSMIDPYHSYCNAIWASNYHSRLKELTVLQNRDLRVVAGSRCHYSVESADPVYARLHIYSVLSR